MDRLAAQGMIRRMIGRGTFVQSPQPAPVLTRSLKIVLFNCMERSAFFPHNAAVSAIERVLRRDRHDLIIRDNRFERAPDMNAPALMIDDALSQADGVIWISAFITQSAALPKILHDRAARIVFINHAFQDRAATCVMRDDVEGQCRVVAHLIALGHRRIGFLGGPEHRLSSRARYRGFQAAMDAAGLEVNADWVRPYLPDITMPWGRRAMSELISLSERPTACACVTDVTAAGALGALVEGGFAVPRDMAVTGFDNHCSPEMPDFLTSADTAFDDIGREAALHLVSQIEGRTQPGILLQVPCPLVVRGST